MDTKTLKELLADGATPEEIMNDLTEQLKEAEAELKKEKFEKEAKAKIEKAKAERLEKARDKVANDMIEYIEALDIEPLNNMTVTEWDTTIETIINTLKKSEKDIKHYAEVLAKREQLETKDDGSANKKSKVSYSYAEDLCDLLDLMTFFF